MKKLLSILFALILTISIAGCNSGEQVPCPVVDYQTNEKDNPVNTWCKEYFKDSEKIYAIGEHSGPEERGMEMVKKISESKARVIWPRK